MKTRLVPLALAIALLLAVPSAGSATVHDGDAGRPSRPTASAADPWRWPVRSPRVVAAYAEPPHAFGSGHRGIDLAADSGDTVMAPAAGIVAFSGTVVDRGVVTIDHGGGLTTTLEPVSDAHSAGAFVAAGEAVARVDAGGHAAAGSVHFGVRLDGRYINPLQLLGGIPRAVLLPCC